MTIGLHLNFKIIDFKTPEEVQEEKRKARMSFVRNDQNDNKDWFKQASHLKLIGNAIGTLFIILIILGQIISFPKQIKPLILKKRDQKLVIIAILITCTLLKIHSEINFRAYKRRSLK